MNVSKPVAASDEGVVIGFQYPYLCQKAIEDQELQDALTNGLSRLVDQQLNLIFLPNDQWLKIRKDYLNKRQSKDDSSQASPEEHSEQTPEIITKAQELFGKENIDVEED